MHPRDVLQTNLRLIEGIAERVCRRARVYGADADDFAATVKLRLVENDYAVLREFQGHSSLGTYLTIVIRRWLADVTIREHGRWHVSAEAARLGAAAVLLESLVHRERRTLDEALPLVQAAEPSLTRADAEALLRRLPERRRRPVLVDLDSMIAPAADGRRSAEDELLEREARTMTERATPLLRELLRSLSVEDRMIVKMRFAQSMSVADIARMLRLPQRPLYRRIEALLAALRNGLAAAGVDPGHASDLISAAASMTLDFGLADPDVANETTQRKEMP